MNTQAATTTKNAKASKMPPKADAQPAAKKGKSKEAAPVMVDHSDAEFRFVPFNKLVRSPLNVRSVVEKPSKESLAALEELAALIYSQSVLQNLVGYPEKKKNKETGNIAINAGGRRLSALGLLFSRGQIAADYPVPVRIVTEEEAISMSLAENSGREPMHPADEFMAMRAMVEDQGKRIEDVAAAFGVTPLVVKRRLKLANVAPKFIELYKAGKTSLETLMALALTDDHEAQEQAWNAVGAHYRDSYHLRRMITQNEIQTSSPLAKFVGVKAYEKAGGAVRRDLFSNGDGYIQDPALLHQLASEKLLKAAEEVKAEGWKWVETRAECADWQLLQTYSQARAKPRAPTPEEQQEIDKLSGEIDALHEKLDAEEDDDAIEKLSNDIEAAEEKMQALHNNLIDASTDLKAFAGALVTLDHHGEMIIHRGRIHPDDRKQAAKELGGDLTGGDGGEKVKAVHSERLVRTLSAHRTAALQACVAAQPDIALIVLTHKLASRVFMEYPMAESVCEVSGTRPNLEGIAPDVEKSRALQELHAKRDEWAARMPEDGTQLFGWLLEQHQEDVMALMALCVALNINAVQQRETTTRNTAADELAAAVGLDMADWWTPTADTYFSHVSKARIAEVVTEAGAADAAKAIAGMKKGEAATAAEKAVAGSRWVPELMRKA